MFVDDIDDDMAALVAANWDKPPPGKVARWESDGQGGGCIWHLTPEDAKRFDEAKAANIYVRWNEIQNG